MRTPPQLNGVPRFLEPRKLAAQGKTIAGAIAPSECPRLLQSVLEIKAPLVVALSFYKDEQKRVRLSGTVDATVTRTCQRCLGELDVRLATEIEVAVVFSEEEVRNLPRELDPWHASEEATDIVALVEDELLVALPMVSCHPQGECAFPAGYGVEDEGVRQENPFNVLEQLKRSASE